MEKENLIEVLATAGTYLKQHADQKRSDSGNLLLLNELLYEEFEEAILNEHVYNGWFTEENIRRALKGIAFALEESKVSHWLAHYDHIPIKKSDSKTIGLVMAGNIPLVGFHDLISVLVSGHTLMAKQSSKDERMIKLFVKLLVHIDSSLRDKLNLTEGYIHKTDAMIATGSNNSGRYFEYYFKDIPHIIRKNRNSVAVLNGQETTEDLYNLGDDIFSYYGLGCRNVTKLYIPEDYKPEKILEVLEEFQSLTNHNKYCNNLDYNRTIFLMKNEPYLDNGVVLFKESKSISSPVGVVYFEKYTELEDLKEELTSIEDQIQCIVSIDNNIEGGVRPGQSQYPELWEYADGFDTLQFLTDLK